MQLWGGPIPAQPREVISGLPAQCGLPGRRPVRKFGGGSRGRRSSDSSQTQTMMISHDAGSEVPDSKISNGADSDGPSPRTHSRQVRVVTVLRVLPRLSGSGCCGPPGGRRPLRPGPRSGAARAGDADAPECELASIIRVLGARKRQWAIRRLIRVGCLARCQW